MASEMKRRLGSIKITVIVALLLCATVVTGSIYFRNVDQGIVLADDLLTYETFRGNFVSTVNESGDIESSRNEEIRCEVKSQGRAGTAILKVVDEGTKVKKGDFLCQLDDSVLKDQLTEQKIKVAQDRASVIQSESDLDTAERILNEFQEGVYAQQLAALNAEVALAEESARRASEVKKHSKTLNRKGYITRTQLEADEFAQVKADQDLKLAKQKLDVYEKYTKDRMVSEFESEIEQQKAYLEAADFTWKLSQDREEDIATQIANCRVVAPNDGMVIFANETDRRGDASFVIEEGALLRDGQPVFRLPDPNQMQVRATVSDSKINQIKEGQEVLVRVDTDPEKPVAGKVRRVSAFPLPRRWYQAPIEYEVFVDITELNDLIRPGLRGKVEIVTDRVADVIQAPVSSLLREDGRYFVLLKVGEKLDVREVEICNNNERFAVIKGGLEVGELVLIDPDPYRDQIEFPAS